MKYIILTTMLLLLLSNSHSVAQVQGQARVDSLLSELPKSKGDTVQAKILLYLGDAYNKIGLFDTARSYLKRATLLSQNAKNKSLELKCLNNIGISYFYQAAYLDALKIWEQVLAGATEIKDKKVIKSVQTNMANVFSILGNYPRATASYMTILKEAEAVGDNDAALDCITNMAVIFSLQNQYDKACEYYLRAEVLSRKIADLSSYSHILNNLGETYIDMQQYNKALECFNKVITISHANKFTDNLARAYYGMGRIKGKQNKLREELENYNTSNMLFRESGDRNMIASLLVNVASIYSRLTEKSDEALLAKLFHGNKKEALLEGKKKVDEAMAVLNEIGNMENLKTAYQVSSEINSKLGNFKLALENYIRFKEISDTLFNEERDKKLTSTAMQYDFDKKEASTKAEQEKKDAVAEQKLQRQKLVRNVFVGGFAVVLIFAGIFFSQRNKIKAGKRRSDELLLNILPEEVAEELKVKGEAEARLIDEVTVLFTDFKGFTALSEKLTPKELVRDLHECFTAFDNIMHRHGLEKIKTIGDAYMAAGGLPTPNKTHAFDVVSAALEIRQFMAEGKAKKIASQQPYFEIRIGVHTGPVVAGIVGVKKFSYDIWGDTVNTASRMESSGEVDKVNISGTTYELVKDKFTCVDRGKVTAKGKGVIDMYFVE